MRELNSNVVEAIENDRKQLAKLAERSPRPIKTPQNDHHASPPEPAQSESTKSVGPVVTASGQMSGGKRQTAAVKNDMPEANVVSSGVLAGPQTKTQPPTQEKTQEDWLKEICNCTTKFVGGIVATGKLLCEAKTALKGEWDRFKKCEKSPFTARKTDMLMSIANNNVLQNAQVHAHFPDAWTILYILSRLDIEVLERAVADGRVHPRMTLKDAKELDPLYAPKPPKPLSPAALDRIAQRIAKSVPAWSAKSDLRNKIVKSLAFLAEKIDSVKAEIEVAPGDPADGARHSAP